MSLIAERQAERWFPTNIPSSKEARIQQDTIALEAFVREACKTLDEHDKNHPIKPIPLDELEYLRYFYATLLRERIVIVPKSRQIMITWASYCYILWNLLRWRGQKWALVPKKQEDGERHVEERLKETLWAELPEWLRNQYELADVKGSFALLTKQGKRWRSALLVYPQGADQLRGETHSGILWDEAWHQPKFRAAWKGAQPTIQGRKGEAGQVVIISSVAPNHYVEKLCGGKLREAISVARGEAA